MSAHFAPLAELSVAQRGALFALLGKHFAGVERDGFDRDLADKTHVLRLVDGEGRLLGFSTIDYRRRRFGDDDGALLYSGDTIVDPAAWAGANLGPAWVAAVFALHAAQQGGPLWWLLLTSGVRTHRYLDVYCRHYHPAPPGRDDGDAATLLPGLCAERFADRFDPTTGVVRLDAPQALLPHLATLPPHLADDASVAFFLARNPGWRSGEELASLCRLDVDNLTTAGQRALAIGRRAALAQR